MKPTAQKWMRRTGKAIAVLLLLANLVLLYFGVASPLTTIMASASTRRRG